MYITWIYLISHQFTIHPAPTISHNNPRSVFREGDMVGKCLASVLTMFWQSRDVLLKEESPTLAASVRDTNSSNNSAPSQVGSTTS